MGTDGRRATLSSVEGFFVQCPAEGYALILDDRRTCKLIIPLEWGFPARGWRIARLLGRRVRATGEPGDWALTIADLRRTG